MSINWLWLIPIGLSLIGVAFSVASGIMFARALKQSATFERARAIVIGYRREYDSDAGHDVYYPQVEFRTLDDRSVRFSGSTGSAGKVHRIGATIDVLYDPRHPERAVIDSFGERYLAPLLCAVLALGAFGFSVPLAMAVRDSSWPHQRASGR